MPLLLSFLISTPVLSESIRALVKINKDHKGTQIYRAEDRAPIPSIERNKAVKEQLDSLKAGDEAIVEGYISYQPADGIEGKSLKPFFIIESVHPISLKSLGTIDTKISDQPLRLESPTEFSPLTIPVSTEVASAITMTSSLLLLESLSAGPGPQANRDMTKSLIISAGTMATILFIYDQMK